MCLPSVHDAPDSLECHSSALQMHCAARYTPPIIFFLSHLPSTYFVYIKVTLFFFFSNIFFFSFFHSFFSALPQFLYKITHKYISSTVVSIFSACAITPGTKADLIFGGGLGKPALLHLVLVFCRYPLAVK